MDARTQMEPEGDHERKMNRRGTQRTLPFKFQVPTKHTQFFIVEYSDDLGWKNQHCYGAMHVWCYLCSRVALTWS